MKHIRGLILNSMSLSLCGASPNHWERNHAGTPQTLLALLLLWHYLTSHLNFALMMEADNKL